MKRSITTYLKMLGATAACVGIAGIGLAAYLRATNTHVIKTMGGLAVIHTIYDKHDRPIRVLEVQKTFESALYTDEQRYMPVFAYQQAFDRVFEAKLPSQDVLMIGGGGCAWPIHLVWHSETHRPISPTDATSQLLEDLTVDVVEIDPAIISAARRWFFVDELLATYPDAHSKLRLICADGRSFVDNLAAQHNPEVKRYAAIVGDTFSGKQPIISLTTREALQAIKHCLVPGGVYAANVVSEEEGDDITFLRQVVTTLSCVFKHVHIVPCEDEDFGLEDNYLVLASDAPHVFSDTLPFDDDFLSTPLYDEQLHL